MRIERNEKEGGKWDKKEDKVAGRKGHGRKKTGKGTKRRKRKREVRQVERDKTEGKKSRKG